ncbi:MAG: hypothetical protein LBO73_02740 [Holosporaceae bacterium]|jgi:hypothetical protein|nr:hypothetical protein [Holosporaceae bacterium]
MLEILKKNKCEAALILAALAACFICYARIHFFTVFFGYSKIRFFDTDDYITVVRIRDFFYNPDLYNSVLSRANVPFGGDMHWPRIYDLCLIIPSFIFNLFSDSVEKSTEYAGFLISPVIKCVTVVVLYDLFGKIMSKSAAFAATLIFAIHPSVNYINMFGRPDHHAFIMMLTVIYLRCLAELCETGYGEIACRKAAAVAALCVWASPETLMFLLAAEAVLFFRVYDDLEKLKAVYRKNMIAACIIGLIVFLFCRFDIVDVLCFSVLAAVYRFTSKDFQPMHAAALLLTALAFSTLPQQEYDKISVVHVVLYMCAALFFGILRIHRPRLGLSCAVGIGVGLFFLYMFPKFLYGMGGDISEELKTVWLADYVDEMKSPFHFGKMPSIFFSVYMIISSVAVYNKICDLVRKKSEDTDTVWMILIATCFCYQLFASMADRMRPAYTLLSIPFIVDLAVNGEPLKFLPGSAKIVLAFFLSLSVDVCQKYRRVFWDLYANPSEFRGFCVSRKEAYLQEDRFFKFLDGISEKPVVILTYLGKSPMVLYYTKHSVVSIPYHRQEKGILAFFSVMEENYDGEKIKKILETTGTSYIFISKSMCYSNIRTYNSLAGMIVRGVHPDWIDIVKIPSEFKDIILARINKQKLSESR